MMNMMNSCEICRKVVPERRCVLCNKMICDLDTRKEKYCLHCYSNEESFVKIESIRKSERMERNKKIYKYFCGCIKK